MRSIIPIDEGVWGRWSRSWTEAAEETFGTDYWATRKTLAQGYAEVVEEVSHGLRGVLHGTPGFAQTAGGAAMGVAGLLGGIPIGINQWTLDVADETPHGLGRMLYKLVEVPVRGFIGGAVQVGDAVGSWWHGALARKDPFAAGYEVAVTAGTLILLGLGWRGIVRGAGPGGPAWSGAADVAVTVPAAGAAVAGGGSGGIALAIPAGLAIPLAGSAGGLGAGVVLMASSESGSAGHGRGEATSVAERAKALVAIARRKGPLDVLTFQRRLLGKGDRPTDVSVRHMYSEWRKGLTPEDRAAVDEAMAAATGRPGGRYGSMALDPKVRAARERAVTGGRMDLARQLAASARREERITVEAFERVVMNANPKTQWSTISQRYGRWRGGLSPKRRWEVDRAMKQATGKPGGRRGRPSDPTTRLERAAALAAEAHRTQTHMTVNAFQAAVLRLDSAGRGRAVHDAYAHWRAGLSPAQRRRLDAHMEAVTARHGGQRGGSTIHPEDLARRRADRTAARLARAREAGATAQLQGPMPVAEFQRHLLDSPPGTTPGQVKRLYSHWRLALGPDERGALDRAMEAATGRRGGQLGGIPGVRTHGGAAEQSQPKAIAAARPPEMGKAPAPRATTMPRDRTEAMLSLRDRLRLEQAEALADAGRQFGDAISPATFQNMVIGAPARWSEAVVTSHFREWLYGLPPQIRQRVLAAEIRALNGRVEAGAGRADGSKDAPPRPRRRPPAGWPRTGESVGGEAATGHVLSPRDLTCLQRAEDAARKVVGGSKRVSRFIFMAEVLGKPRATPNSLTTMYAEWRRGLPPAAKDRLDIARTAATGRLPKVPGRAAAAVAVQDAARLERAEACGRAVTESGTWMSLLAFQRKVLGVEGEANAVRHLYRRWRGELPAEGVRRLDAAHEAAIGRPASVRGMGGAVRATQAARWAARNDQRVARAEAAAAAARRSRTPMSVAAFARRILAIPAEVTTARVHGRYGAWRRDLPPEVLARLDRAQATATGKRVDGVDRGSPTVRPGTAHRHVGDAAEVGEPPHPLAVGLDIGRPSRFPRDASPAARLQWAKDYADWLIARDRTVTVVQFRRQVLAAELGSATVAAQWAEFVRALSPADLQSLDVAIGAVTRFTMSLR